MSTTPHWTPLSSPSHFRSLSLLWLSREDAPTGPEAERRASDKGRGSGRNEGEEGEKGMKARGRGMGEGRATDSERDSALHRKTWTDIVCLHVCVCVFICVFVYICV